MAVRTVVCAQWVQQCVAERLVVVCSSARGSVQLSGSAVVYGSLRRCAAVCGNVCAAVCGSSVRQCCSVWQCAAVCSVRQQCTAVRQCAAVCGGVRQYAAMYVRQCAAVCGSSVWQCGSVWQCVQPFAAMRSAVRTAVCGSALYMYIQHKCAHNICQYALIDRGSRNEPHISRILILTNRSIRPSY
jgi:hypothetical protein